MFKVIIQLVFVPIKEFDAKTQTDREGEVEKR